jgi:membrane protease YdiL (CAAX protease family)
MIAAALVTELAGGDVLAWARQVVPKPGVGLRWYLLALTAPFVLIQTPELLAWIAGVPVTLVEPREVVVEFLLVLVLAGGLEKFGWRGFVQPRLQERRSALVAALAVGIVWALWHVPIVAGGGSGYQGGEWVGFLLFLPLMSIVLTWLYNSTRGGLLFVMIGHAVINATPVIEGSDAIAGGAAQLLALVGLPLAIVLYYGTPYLAANRPTSPIPGEVEASAQYQEL